MIQLKNIIKTDRIIKVSPDETLSYAISKMRTSHDAAFVFDEDEKFMGVVNPYYALIKSSYPGNSKVSHCLYHPPKLHIDFSISKVAELFIESKIHYLPIFDDKDKFLGIISARHLLSTYTGSPIFHLPISEILQTKTKPLFTIDEDDDINSAIEIYRRTKVSKLVILNKDLKLKGVLSYYDLISYLVSPKESPHRGQREGNHISFHHLKIKNFAKTYTLTLSAKDQAAKALEMIINKKIGSIVIVDDERHPIGILTTKDFLNILWKNGYGKNPQIITRNFSQQSRQILGGFFKGLSFILSRGSYT
ncbi:hypothetical protein A2767_06355 [Candidatus Roizmanbacteria bacterium RIFCSPHIGHO2_01_FULL_35_10]|uniref:CBS domain-containing protein n=1 Tax=Candidatus Roizmanbacteria bacterium RIFCSPLOWO2_01_FULL_35_13 TaxID=1802055 RepID=A0A1F7IFF0_9BACT|nr:MAG: hypothetical protein A2767_06355 [Candidatus Roizmanbacteria bacterium RIFCSPHIGHO2_01_FULL_35_10]OGK42098.1 MAG: hypothetical protein A3A74_05005 [Candidatus Roizmanbacteria bacterium RIFCSPLOWO2_01_FULL_35_13]